MSLLLLFLPHGAGGGPPPMSDVVYLTDARVDIALGGSWRKLVAALNPSVWYQFNRYGSTAARDSSSPTVDGTLSGGASQTVLDWRQIIPEGGIGCSFDGVNGAVAASFPASTTTFTIECWIWPNSPSVAGTILTDTTDALQLSTSRVPDFFFGAASHNASAALTDQALSHLVVVVSGGNGTFYINGVAAGTFSGFGGFTPTAIGLSGAARPLKATLDEFVYYVGYAMPAGEVAAHYAAGLWTDVSIDVWDRPGVTLQYGINGRGPADRIGGPGSAGFDLFNDAANSGGAEGYYSPDHIAVRPGFTRGDLVRISALYNGTREILFTGKIDTVDPAPGKGGSKRVSVVVADIMTDLIDADLRNVTLQINQLETALLTALVEAIPITAQPLGLRFGTGLDTSPYAFDQLGPGEKAIKPASDITLSSMGFLWTDRYGILRYANRDARAGTGLLQDFEHELTDVVARTGSDGVFNRIRLTVHPKRIDAAATTVLCSMPLASATNPSTVSINPSETIVIWDEYVHPSNPEQRIGGTAQVTPAATTDYLANSAADGSGTDKTANITVVAAPFASTVKWTITNNDAALVYITKRQLRGKGLYDEAPVTVEAASAVVPPVERPIEIDLPNQGSRALAQSLANDLLSQHEDPSNQSDVLGFRGNVSDAFMLAALRLEIGARLRISEAVTGLVEADMFVQNIRLDLKPGLQLHCAAQLSANDVI